MRPVCVIGLGLIGGSVLRAATARADGGWGATASAVDAGRPRRTASRVEPTVADALRRAAREDALIVVAVPLPAVDEVLRLVAEHAPDCLLTDVVSVKEPVVAAVARRLPTPRYAGGHPMAGKSVSGWDAGSADAVRRRGVGGHHRGGHRTGRVARGGVAGT